MAFTFFFRDNKLLIEGSLGMSGIVVDRSG